MKRFIIMVVIFTLLVMTGCGISADTAEETQQKQTNQLLEEANKQMGLPNIVNFQQKKLMKMIYEISDSENLICYAYIKSDYQGKLVFIGKCLGYGVPFSAQYTNPLKTVDKYHNYGIEQLPQADPNGLYMPTSSSATWLLMINPAGGEPRPVYIEPEITVSPFALH